MNPEPTCRIALAQTTAGNDREANLEHALRLLSTAAARGAQLLAFPEVFLYTGDREGKLRHAIALDDEIIQLFRKRAREAGMILLLGSIHEKLPQRTDKVCNTSVLIDAEGEIAAVYRKMKLFDVTLPHCPVRESDTILAGQEMPPVAATAHGRVGLTICFDLRFPELYRHLRSQGAQIVFVPSNFSAHTGAAHWMSLLRARAIENQVYLVAAAQIGRNANGFLSYGHSVLIDPWGTVITQAPDAPALIFGEIDLRYLERVRRELPLG